MATIRKTTYRCDACGQTVAAKSDLKQFRVEMGPRGYYYRNDNSVGIKADFCDSCEVKFLDALAPFYSQEGAQTLRREPPKPKREPKKKAAV